MSKTRSGGRWGFGWQGLLAILAVVMCCSNATLAYSVLTHEEIVDLVWEDQIRPLLLRRFPGLSEEQIREAHAQAYGGSVIHDLGYYPFGSKDFSNLVHYVRSGDFVRELVLQGQNVNEYAFALGALAHYASDMAGHPAVNHAVAMLYPKLRTRFGSSVRFATPIVTKKDKSRWQALLVAGDLWLGTQPRDVENGAERWIVKVDRKTGKIQGVVESLGHHSIDLNADGEPLTGARPDKVLWLRRTPR